MTVPIQDFLPLAGRIAREFSNIPGIGFSEVEMRAQEALASAARAFDPARGKFEPYAATAIRNALRSLFDKQIRHHHHHAYILDQPAHGMESEGSPPLVEGLARETQSSPATKAGRRLSNDTLQRAMRDLPPRYTTVLVGVASGKSYSEIGAEMGISKQAVGKIVQAAAASLRERLAGMGYLGLDTLGFLKSSKSDSA